MDMTPLSTINSPSRPVQTTSTDRVNLMFLYIDNIFCSITYGHRLWKLGHPVRSAVLKPQIGSLVLRWVTTGESGLLYVLHFFWRDEIAEEDRYAHLVLNECLGKYIC